MSQISVFNLLFGNVNFVGGIEGCKCWFLFSLNLILIISYRSWAHYNFADFFWCQVSASTVPARLSGRVGQRTGKRVSL